MLVFTLVLILLLFFVYKRKQQLSTFEKLGIPGPKPNYIFGNLIDISREGFHGVFPKWTKKHGPIVGFYFGGRPQVLITDLELIRNIMVKDFHIFSNKSQCVPGGIHPVPHLQNMLVWLRDNVWRNLRASVSPSFSSHKLNAMKPLMMTSIDELISELDFKAASGQEFNLKPFVTELTFSGAVKCIFGLNYTLNQSNEAENFLKAVAPRLDKSILATAMILFPSLTFLAYPIRVLWETIRFYMLWSPEGVTYKIAKEIVQYRRDKGSQSVDFLQLLLNAKRIRSTNDIDLEMSSDENKTNFKSLSKEVESDSLSEEEIVSNAMLFLLASFETTAVTLQFVLHNLINNPNIQEKLRNELRKALEKDGTENLQFSTLAKVPLLSHVIKETLRMFPPVMPFTTRVGNEDYEYNGITIPKGVPVYIGVSSIHNDPNLWSEPEKFQPDRFGNEFDKLSYLPFGAG